MNDPVIILHIPHAILYQPDLGIIIGLRHISPITWHVNFISCDNEPTVRVCAHSAIVEHYIKNEPSRPHKVINADLPSFIAMENEDNTGDLYTRLTVKLARILEFSLHRLNELPE